MPLNASVKLHQIGNILAGKVKYAPICRLLVIPFLHFSATPWNLGLFLLQKKNNPNSVKQYNLNVDKSRSKNQ